jgi:hypothetical protein
MPDISRCTGGYCPLKLNCHRHTGEMDSLSQPYFSEPPYKMSIMLDEHDITLGVVTTACTFFWNNAKYKKDEQKPTNN